MFTFSLLHNLLLNDCSSDLVKYKLCESLACFYDNLYVKRPFPSNEGGMGLESSFFLWSIIEKLKPTVVVESGVWKGFTTFLLDNLESTEKIYCFDPIVSSPGFIKYRSSKASYFDTDWATPHFTFIKSDESLAFFDDHQDQLERLMLAYIRGYSYVVFDDNYFFGGGGHSGLADYMRKCPNILNEFVEQIYIAPPLLFIDKGIDPLFSSSDYSMLPTVFEIITEENNYNWLTLVKLKKPPFLSHSQVPGQEHVLSTYSRAI